MPYWMHLREALLSVALVAGTGDPFTITFRFGSEVIGPAAAIDLVLPTTAGGTAGASEGAGRGARQAGRARAARVAEVWVTLHASTVADRLTKLARAAASGRAVTGTCEISVAGASGAVVRRYVVSGCFAKRVDVVGDARRVALGYSAISEP